MALNLDKIIRIPTADRYNSPRDPSQRLPIVLGDFLDTNAAPTDELDLTPAISVDPINAIYVVNAVESHPDTPKVYVNHVENPSSIFTYNPANDLEGQGEVVLDPFVLPAALTAGDDELAETMATTASWLWENFEDLIRAMVAGREAFLWMAEAGDEALGVGRRELHLVELLQLRQSLKDMWWTLLTEEDHQEVDDAER